MIEDIKLKKGKYDVCIKKLLTIGIPQIDAKIICGQQLLGDGKDCVSKKVSIFSKEHPDWSHDKTIAAAHGYCRSHGLKDAIKPGKISSEIGRLSGISMRKLGSLIKLIKSKKGLKIGHAGILPFKIELPQKNLNRLQTKLERLVTEESKLLTAEQSEQRSQYATYMKKGDSEEQSDEDFIKELEEEISIIIGLNDDLPLRQIEDSIIRYLTPFRLRKNVWVDSTVEVGKANLGMNNIIKAPITLAVEMIQEYRFQNEDGSIRVEKHLKDYDELKMAIIGLNKLYMTVDHKEDWTFIDTIGCVRQIYADDKTRSIRGMGYFKTIALPEVLKDALENGLPFGVSIGFLAELDGPGIFKGVEYNFVQRNIQLDHLTVTVISSPRCPIESCGVNVENQKIVDNMEFTLINKSDNYYNINNILLDFKETIEKQNQEEILGDIMQEDGFKDPSSGKVAGDEPKLYEEMFGKLRKWLAGVTDPDVKSALKAEIIKLFGDNIEMNDKEFEDAIAKKDSKIDTMNSMLKRMLKRDILSFTDKFTTEKLDNMSLEKLEVLSELVSDPDIRTEKKAEIIPIEGKDTKEEEQKKEYKRIDPSSIFLDTNKEFMLDSFIASNFGEKRK